jgi:hypothetical protein
VITTAITSTWSRFRKRRPPKKASRMAARSWPASGIRSKCRPHGKVEPRTWFAAAPALLSLMKLARLMLMRGSGNRGACKPTSDKHQIIAPESRVTRIVDSCPIPVEAAETHALTFPLVQSRSIYRYIHSTRIQGLAGRYAFASQTRHARGGPPLSADVRGRPQSGEAPKNGFLVSRPAAARHSPFRMGVRRVSKAKSRLRQSFSTI